jgi:hypothetical protein
MADINDLLNESEVRPGQPYFSPAHVVTVDTGPHGVRLWIGAPQMMQFFPVQLSAPDITIKSVQTHTVQPLSVASISGSGQAPTISYTGVEDMCQ